MVFAAKVKVGSYRKKRGIRENDKSVQWFFSPFKAYPIPQDLEDEIYCLRKRMEQMFNQEQSLTSESVIELSNKLDQKINEYMNMELKNR